MKNGIALIGAERQRQIEKEGYTVEHDQQRHCHGGLVAAAIAYAMPSDLREPADEVWPWDIKLFKPTPNDRICELTKAGALIAAEIDRLLAKDAESSGC